MDRILYFIRKNIIIVLFIVSGIFTSMIAQELKVLKGTIEVVRMFDDNDK